MTLKILRSRRARSTLIPKEVPGLMAAQTTSKMLPTMTCRGEGQAPAHSAPRVHGAPHSPALPASSAARAHAWHGAAGPQAQARPPCQEDTDGVTDGKGRRSPTGGQPTERPAHQGPAPAVHRQLADHRVTVLQSPGSPWVGQWAGLLHLPARSSSTAWTPALTLPRLLTHPEVEAVEGGPEVAPGPQAIHLQGHLCEEETQENKLCKV